MSFRVLPVFSGKSLWSPRLAYLTYALLLAGTAMRLLQYPAAFNPVFYEIGAYMGIPVVLALILFTFNLFRTMKGKRAGQSRTPAAPRPIGFASTLPVRSDASASWNPFKAELAFQHWRKETSQSVRKEETDENVQRPLRSCASASHAGGHAGPPGRKAHCQAYAVFGKRIRR